MSATNSSAVPWAVFARCPRCGNYRQIGAFDVCAPCAAAEGWDPHCEACRLEGKGQDPDGVRHVPTCGVSAALAVTQPSAPPVPDLHRGILVRCDPAWYGLRDNPPQAFAALRAVVDLCMSEQVEAVGGGLTDADQMWPSDALGVIARELGVNVGGDRG